MSSQINPNNIDGNYPVAGQDNNSQGFRDNFTNTKTNFQYAENEINDLQDNVLLKAALVGTTLDNNMNDNLIYAAKIRDFSATKVSVTSTSGTITLDYAEGHYQTISTTGSISLAFTNFPPAGSYGYMRIQVNVTNVAHTMTIPSAVSLGLSGVQGISPGTSGVSNTITFGSTGYYEFGFSSSDSGATITLFDLNRGLTNFISADIQTDDLTATGNVSAVGNVVGGNVRTAGYVSSTGNVVGGNVNAVINVSAVGNVVGGNLFTAGTVTTTGNVQAGYLNGFVRPTAGTTVLAPVSMSAGTLLVTPATGSVEKDSDVFYATPTGGSASSQRGVWPAQHLILTPSGGRALTQNTAAQAVFGSPSSGKLTLTASTTYELEAMYYISNNQSPSTAHSISTLFNMTGTLTSIAYVAEVSTSAGNPSAGATSISRNFSTAATALQVTPAGTTTNNEVIIIHLRGIVRVNTSGDFTPQIQYNTNAPGGTSTVLENSWLRMSALGSSTVISVGNWA